MSISYGGDYITDTDGGKLRPSSAVMRNRILNGGMVIDQRNAGASVTPASGSYVYSLDRWTTYASQSSKMSVQQNAGSVTPPVGFSSYLGVTSLSAYTVGAGEEFVLTQFIEGNNVADLNWGSADAATITLSFKVRSSLTGTFGGALINSAQNRAYPFSYTISSANTWETKSITIAGDTSGTWLTTTGRGIQVTFSLGVGSTYSGTAGAWTGSYKSSATGATSVVGTNGATWYMTGCQLEVGSSATGFEYRQYGTELALCQRYFYLAANAESKPLGVAAFTSAGDFRGCIWFPVTMRTNPSISVASGTGYYRIYGGSSYNISFDSFGIDLNNTTACALGAATGLSGASAGIGGIMLTNNSSAKVSFSAEL